MYYLAFIYPDADGFGFTCPDVAGFTAYAETSDLDTAVKDARQVLAAHLAALVDAGGELPRPRALAALRADPDLAQDFAEAAATIMLPALVPSGRTVRVNFSIDENSLALIDDAAQVRGLTRSAFIVEAARSLV